MDNEEYFPTPDFAHLTSQKEFINNVYEPSDDTFLFLDALTKERDYIKSVNPSICLEIGCGSGCVITFLAQLLGKSSSHFMATDLNEIAGKASLETARRNNIHLDVVRTDLLESLMQKLHNKIDILLFNPPYVPTSEEELIESVRHARQSHSTGSSNEGVRLEAAWAGGINGRQVLDRLLPHIKNVISPGGCFYLVAVEDNKPKEIMVYMIRQGFKPGVVMKRVAQNEVLYILKFVKPKENQS